MSANVIIRGDYVIYPETLVTMTDHTSQSPEDHVDSFTMNFTLKMEEVCSTET
jgi:hypothetical protein